MAVLLALPTGVKALYLGDMVNVARVADGSIKVDGKPETVWKAIYAANRPVPMSFDDYKRIVILKSDAIRNDPNPANYYTAPATGSVTLLAAYDNTALYFFFLVKENTTFDPSTLCSLANLWTADAPDVFVDPSPWDPINYSAFFSKDGSGLVNGTSPKTVELAKPISPKDTRIYFRDRNNLSDGFKIPAPLPTGVAAATSVHSSTDSLTFGVEMKIPFWSGKVSDFAPGKSMYISWGYNHLSDPAKAKCNATTMDSTPIAYRWAKHYKTYAAADPKPDGWRSGDSTHFDPTRSWDGWGQMNLNYSTVDGSHCHFSDSTSWDLAVWKSGCAVVTSDFKSSQPKDHSTLETRPASGGSGVPLVRDLRGRMVTPQAWVPVFPWQAPAK